MSSLIDASETLGHETQSGECDSGIIHFDATQRRKEKMRRKSHDSPPDPESKRQSSAVFPTKPAPAAEPRAKITPQPTPIAPAKRAATLEAYGDSAPTPASAEGALTSLSGAELERFLIDFVVEQTGYPPEMVELDADLEADLGIDSIKKAQLFGELAERFEISIDVTDENLSLDDFPTLADVMRFLESHSPAAPADSAQEPSAPPVVEPSPVTANGNGAIHGLKPVETAASSEPNLAGIPLETFLIDFVVEQTGYPPEMVELDADLEADLGIDSIKKAQLFGELAEQFQISVDASDENLSLDDFPTLRHVLDFLESAGSKTPSPIAQDAPAPATKPAEPSDVLRSGNGVHSPKVEAEKLADSNGLALEELETFLVNFVVEQTGYPPEMVELDADLEADLGIDSIKKAQMMGELAEQFEISIDASDENLSLDDFPTLRHVSNFLAAPGKAAVSS